MPKKFSKPPRIYTFDQWQKIIQDWKKSGLTKQAYCSLNDVVTTTFHKWEKILADPELSKRAYDRAKAEVGRRYTLEQWKDFIKEWKKSGLSRDAFSREKGLASTTLYSWIQKVDTLERLQNQKSISSYQPAQSKSSIQDLFIPVTLKQDSINASSSKDFLKVELTLSQGHRLSIQGAAWDDVISLLTPLLTQ